MLSNTDGPRRRPDLKAATIASVVDPHINPTQLGLGTCHKPCYASRAADITFCAVNLNSSIDLKTHITLCTLQFQSSMHLKTCIAFCAVHLDSSIDLQGRAKFQALVCL